MPKTTLPFIENHRDTPALNALSHGLLSKQLLLPWEEQTEYINVLNKLCLEYDPRNLTEEHLVEEIAGIMWRKRRLRIAENAHFHKELAMGYSSTAISAMAHTKTITSPKDFDYKLAIATDDKENQEELELISEYRDPARKIFTLLENSEISYEEGLPLLADGTQEWWKEALAGKTEKAWMRYQPTADCLYKFLKSEALPQYDAEYENVLFRPQVRKQAYGEAFIPDNNTEKFTRYETHLDRKMERTLTVLLRLQEMRKNKESITKPKETI